MAVPSGRELEDSTGISAKFKPESCALNCSADVSSSPCGLVWTSGGLNVLSHYGEHIQNVYLEHNEEIREGSNLKSSLMMMMSFIFL